MLHYAWSRQEWGLGRLTVVGHHHGLSLVTHTVGADSTA